MNQENNQNGSIDTVVNSLSGIFLGALIGGSIGWSICAWILPITLLFQGDTILLGAVVCGVGGYKYGEEFVARLKEFCWWLWW